MCLCVCERGNPFFSFCTEVIPPLGLVFAASGASDQVLVLTLTRFSCGAIQLLPCKRLPAHKTMVPIKGLAIQPVTGGCVVIPQALLHFRVFVMFVDGRVSCWDLRSGPGRDALEWADMLS
jgi:hypothetical protein